MSPWSFHTWGVDILGPFLLAMGQVKFFIVAFDYFTKWVEEEPVTTISVEQLVANFYSQLGIRQSFTSIKHPQANSQAESANKVILRGQRRRVEEAKGRWAKELSQVLWSYHTTLHSTT
ncbi:hypothetical protein CR513_37809, partial [Mucuna pruriens]